MSRQIDPPPRVDDLAAGFAGRYTPEPVPTPTQAPRRRQKPAPQVDSDVTTSRASDVEQSGRVERPVAYTLRLTHDESDQLNGLARSLRRVAGRQVDQSEVLRALIDLADADGNPVSQALRERLTP